LGNLDSRESLLPAARANYGEALAISKESGDHLGELNTLKSFGDLEMREHRFAEAKQNYYSSLAIAQEIGDLLGGS